MRKALRALVRWILNGRTSAPGEPCGGQLRALIEPVQPHPRGTHWCVEENGHLRFGIYHRCRYCTVEWWSD